MSTSDSHTDDTPRSNALEWAVFALGVAITLGVIGFLTVQLVTGTDEPADLRVTLQEPQPREETVFVPVEVENQGDRVAKEAVIEVCAGPESCGSVTSRFIPKGSTRSGMVGLRAPLAAPPASRVVSYRTI
jgi:uncharacterized protein (TIGR02588 family)